MVHPIPGRRSIAAIVALTALGLAGTRAAADDVKLVDGDLLRGEIVSQSDTAVVIEHPTLGRLEIARDQVESITPAEGGAETPAAPPAEPATPPVEEKPKESEWKFAISLSANGSWGNTDEQSARVGFDARRLREDTRFRFDASYYGGLTDGDTTDNNLTAGAVHDWVRPGKKVFLFAQSRYDYDQFESWDHRFSAHGGPGYHLVEREDLTVDLRIGGGTVREWGSNNDSWRFEAMLGVDLEWTISERSSFEFNSQYLPTVDNWQDDYRVITRVGYKLKLDPELNLSLTTGIRHEYLNIVDPGDDRNNTKAFVGLELTF